MMPICLPQVHLSFGRYFWMAWRFTLRSKPSTWLLLVPLLSTLVFLQGLLMGRISLQESVSGEMWLQWGLVLLVLLIPYQMWRAYRRSPLLSGYTRYELNETGVLVQNELQHSEIQWAGLLRYHRFGQWLLLLNGDQTGFYLDLGQVQAPHTGADVLRVLEQHGIQQA